MKACVLALLPMAALSPVAAQPATQITRLTVEAKGELPGFKIEDVPDYLSARMTAAGIAGWVFSPDRSGSVPPDRVEWNFQLSPYAGGGVRQFFPIPGVQKLFGNRRNVSVEERLYLGGQYQTAVSGQAVIQGGSEDKQLSALIARMTQDLLGPAGAWRAIGQTRAAPGTAP